ncbi:hypothetical protein CIY63_000468 [Salmonella enterica subsp. enterica serovar Agbeni]|nr:hypothetical protein [Salmonella enterica]EDS5616748.1 hypothetical protein [Salmonella enterica subsp. enterica serovar Agbeni]EDX4229840.1 hypothetical protein [Salmonella enterica subsp. enterica serovar Agbeni]EDX9373088.1 hypothetical protein [Salmonella enterica]
MSCLLTLLYLHSSLSDPIPTDPVPIPEPLPRPQPMPDPTRRRTKNRLKCRIKRPDLRGYAPADYESLPRE